MMDRREFLKRAVQVGGVAALYNLGVTLEQARAWGVLPAVAGGTTSLGLWPSWDEASEDTFAVDQDGDGAEDTLVWFLENTSAGGNETGRGVMSGADLVLTQNGNIAGATGDPPKRYVDSPNSDFFEATADTLKHFFNGTTFTYIVKCNGMSAKGAIIELYDGTRHLLCDTDGRFYTAGYTTNSDVSWTTDPTLTTGDIYFVLWDDATTTYWGWTTTKPTKLSDFAAANRVNKASIDGTQVTMSRRSVFGSGNTGTTLVTYGYYLLFSDLCLIDNTA